MLALWGGAGAARLGGDGMAIARKCRTRLVTMNAPRRLDALDARGIGAPCSSGPTQ
jgi:hypothetical protein